MGDIKEIEEFVGFITTLNENGIETNRFNEMKFRKDMIQKINILETTLNNLIEELKKIGILQ